jgi:hypothetical protein
MVELSYFALILLLTCCMAAGVVGGVVHTWSLRARTYSLEDRVAIVEGTLSREVKTRAGQERWRKPTKDEEAVALALANPPQPQAKNWWEVALPRSVPHGK